MTIIREEVVIPFEKVRKGFLGKKMIRDFLGLSLENLWGRGSCSNREQRTF